MLVADNSSVNNGSCFLRGYMIPRSSKSLCLYDSRGLSISKSDNLSMLKRWMTEGVSHGEMVIRRDYNFRALSFCFCCLLKNGILIALGFLSWNHV